MRTVLDRIKQQSKAGKTAFVVLVCQVTGGGEEEAGQTPGISPRDVEGLQRLTHLTSLSFVKIAMNRTTLSCSFLFEYLHTMFIDIFIDIISLNIAMMIATSHYFYCFKLLPTNHSPTGFLKRSSAQAGQTTS